MPATSRPIPSEPGRDVRAVSGMLGTWLVRVVQQHRERDASYVILKCLENMRLLMDALFHDAVAVLNDSQDYLGVANIHIGSLSAPLIRWHAPLPVLSDGIPTRDVCQPSR